MMARVNTASPQANHGRMSLRQRITCPHCWHVYSPETSLWVAQHESLLGDPALGAEQYQRFLPTRFNVDGAALDARGFPCHAIACPRCHLPVPRKLLELAPLFISFIGAPSSGKSYFLTAMTWEMRQTLARDFAMTFSDAEPAANRDLNEYEEQLFLSKHPEKLYILNKTETEGDHYNSVTLGNQTIQYLRPFFFSVTPTEQHPNYKIASELSRALCLYDNAGESFLPGADRAAAPVTRHLALSRVRFFLFDPTQDPRFRRACGSQSGDPQMHAQARTSRQETILHEAADRVQRYAQASSESSQDRPLVVVVTKLDAWSQMLDHTDWSLPWKRNKKLGICVVNTAEVEEVSREIRELLLKLTPEVVTAAEGFSRQVVYIPASAIGGRPEVDPASGMLAVRPKSVNPIWVQVPLIYSLAKWVSGLIPRVERK